MKFNYSICYPDKQDIQYFKKQISEFEIIDIYKRFPWNNELEKEIKYFSPSIEINRLNDNSKLIISGLGEKVLSDFMVILFIPKPGSIKDEFNLKEYKDAQVLENQLSIPKTEKLLELFTKSVKSDDLKKFFPSNKELEPNYSLNPVETWIARIGGPLLSILSICTFFIIAKYKLGFWPLILIGSLMLVFIIGSIRFELNLKKNKSS